MTDHKDDIVEIPPEVFETYSLEEKAKAGASPIEEVGLPSVTLSMSEGARILKFFYKDGSSISFIEGKADGKLTGCEYENIGFKRLGEALWFYPLKRS